MQEKRECRRTGYASNCKSGRGAYGAGKEKVWKIR